MGAADCAQDAGASMAGAMNVHWLIPASAVSLLACGAAWAKGPRPLALALTVATFVLLFLLGRQIEGDRDARWDAVAGELRGQLLAPPEPGWLAGFGPGAPWNAWASDGELQCRRAIDGTSGTAPFALLHIRYSQRERRGEEHPDTWYDVSVAAVRLSAPADARPQAVAASPGYEAVRSGQWLFAWKKGRIGAGEALAASELPALLAEARRLAQAPAGP